MPFDNQYESPKTLGQDRIAAVAGAQGIAEGKTTLVIDAGTCITYDLLEHGQTYLGGMISPGIEMRLNSLSTFTGKLPKIEFDVNELPIDLIGRNTKDSILSGVVNSVIEELNGNIHRFKTQYPELKVVLTGGHLAVFESYIKFEIFADPNLVLHGLNRILDHNVPTSF